MEDANILLREDSGDFRQVRPVAGAEAAPWRRASAVIGRATGSLTYHQRPKKLPGVNPPL